MNLSTFAPASGAASPVRSFLVGGRLYLLSAVESVNVTGNTFRTTSGCIVPLSNEQTRNLVHLFAVNGGGYAL